MGFKVADDEAEDAPAQVNGLAPFWMVVVEGGSAPTIRHRSEAVARSEAERLAVKHSQRVYVLKTADSCAPINNVAWTTV